MVSQAKLIKPSVLKRLGFIRVVKDWSDQNFCFEIPNSEYSIVLFNDYENYNKVEYAFWYRNLGRAVNFEEVFNNCPESFKDVFLFNLDLFV